MDDSARTPEAWFRSLPPLTRFGVLFSFVVTLGCSLGLLSPFSLMLDWRKILASGQLWRLLTDYFFAGTFSFAWLMHIYFFVTFSAKLETNQMFNTSPGAYLYFLVFQCLALDILSLLLFWPMGRPVLAPALVMAIIYYWSRKEPFSQCGLWGFQIPAYQFPFALLFLDLIMGQNLMIGLMGLATGHFHYFLKDVLPNERRIDILKITPRFFDEVMRRTALFDITNLRQSLLYLVRGKPSSRMSSSSGVPGGGVMNRQQGGGGGIETSPMPRLFSGPGRRLGSAE